MSLNLTPFQTCPVRPFPQEPLRRRRAKLDRLLLLIVAALLAALILGLPVPPIHAY